MCVFLTLFDQTPINVAGEGLSPPTTHCVAHERAVLMRTALIPSSQSSCRTSYKQIRSLGNRYKLLATLSVVEFHSVSVILMPRQSGWFSNFHRRPGYLSSFVQNQGPSSKDILWVLLASGSADKITWGVGSSNISQ